MGKLKCVYKDCGEDAECIVAINFSEDAWTLPIPVDRRHANAKDKMVSFTYLEGRDPQVEVEYLPEDAEGSIATVLTEIYKQIEEEPNNNRGLWRRMWAQERREREHTYDIMADLVFGLGMPLKVQSPLALPHQLRSRLAHLWGQYLRRTEESYSLVEVEMMLDGTVQWITEESST